MNLSPLPIQKFFDNNGKPLVGGLLFTYEAGTSTKVATYSNESGTLNTNPIVLDYRGECRVWLDPSLTYKFVLAPAGDTDPPGSPIWTVDDITAGITEAEITRQFIGERLWPRTAQEISAGVTPVYYYYPPGDVRRYGATFDGSTDDTVALQNWLSVGGYLVNPVVGTAKITSALTVGSNTSIKSVVGSTIRQYTANTNVLTASSVQDVLISGLTLYAVGSMSSYFNGQGIHVQDSESVYIQNCTVLNHRGWGIQLYNCNESFVTNNTLLDSPVTGSDNHTQCAGDIALTGSSSRNYVAGNVCASGNGIGVSVHALISTDHADNNRVIGNFIHNCKIYGAEAYQTDPASTVVGNVFNDNVIDTVTGTVAHSIDGYVYGAGIYSVGSANTVINGNRIYNTHSGPVVFVDLLAPGAIGVTNCGKVTITDNEISTCGMYGITVRDPGALGPARQKTIVADNNISTVTQIGIQIKEKANVSVLDNQIDTTTSHGIHISNTSTKRSAIKVDGNTLAGVGGTAILVDYTRRSSFSNNIIDTPAVHGILIEHSDDFNVVGNNVFKQATYGIFIDSTCGAHTIDSNMVDGNSSGTYGIYFDAKGNLSQTNRAVNCATANFAGTYNPRPGSIPASGTWAQGDTVYFDGPSAGGNIGAVCTTAGTAGAWKTFGAIAP